MTKTRGKKAKIQRRRQGRKRDIAKREPNGRKQRPSQTDNGTIELQARKMALASKCREVSGNTPDRGLHPEATDWPPDRLWRDDVITDSEHHAAQEYRRLYRMFIGGTGAGRAPVQAEDDPAAWARFKAMQSVPKGVLIELNHVCALDEWRLWMIHGVRTSMDHVQRVSLLAGLGHISGENRVDAA